MKIEDRLTRIENVLWELRFSLAVDDEQLDILKRERENQETRDWEDEMGEDL